MMYEIYGMDWCGACTQVQKHLKARDLPYTYNRLPAGEAGWAIVENMTGRRATPVILKGGRPMEWQEFKAELGAFKPRPLTQDELDDIE